ncbi:MAG: tetratricopeptide repeat protein [Sphingomonas sp.]
MGWLVLLILALLTFAGLWFFIRDKAAVQLLGAALLIALAGYAWQGRPGLAGRPKTAPERQQVPESEFSAMRQNLLGRFDRAAAWLTMAEGFQRRGDTRTGVEVIQAGLRDSPQDADLWVGLGNALVVHANGMMSPAAQLAFQRAARIAPDHPGPAFFYGLALAQGGNYAEAERVWRQLLASAPPNAPYRATIEERLRAIDEARVRGQIPGAAPAAAPPQSSAPGNSQ